MPAVALIAVRTLHEYARIAQALGEHFATNVVQANSFADVPARLLDHLVAIDVREEAQAEALRIRWIGEAVHCDGWLRRVERLADACVQLVVANRAPERRLVIHDRLRVQRDGTGRQTGQTCVKKPRVAHA